NFDPSRLEEFKPQNLTDEENNIIHKQDYFESEPDDLNGYAAVEF
ncbi:MAG: hypothetical protein RLZZ135_1566, partial [Cyanobacteriota bacterium]